LFCLRFLTRRSKNLWNYQLPFFYNLKSARN
jgi:hypothetical protein